MLKKQRFESLDGAKFAKKRQSSREEIRDRIIPEFRQKKLNLSLKEEEEKQERSYRQQRIKDTKREFKQSLILPKPTKSKTLRKLSMVSGISEFSRAKPKPNLSLDDFSQDNFLLKQSTQILFDNEKQIGKPETPMSSTVYSESTTSLHTEGNTHTNFFAKDKHDLELIKKCIDKVSIHDDLNLDNDKKTKKNKVKKAKDNQDTLKIDMLDLKTSQSKIMDKNHQMRSKKREIDNFIQGKSTRAVLGDLDVNSSKMLISQMSDKQGYSDKINKELKNSKKFNGFDKNQSMNGTKRSIKSMASTSNKFNDKKFIVDFESPHKLLEENIYMEAFQNNLKKFV